MRSLVLGELDVATGRLAKSTLQAMSAAQQFKAPSDLFLVRANSTHSFKSPARAFIDADPLRSTEQLSLGISALINKNKYSHVVAASSSLFKDCIPRVGGILGLQPVTEVLAILDNDTFKRPIYAGNAIQTVRAKSACKLLTIRSTAFPVLADEATFEPQPMEESQFTNESMRTSVVESVKSQDTATFPSLTTATRVVAGGRALKSKENFEKLIYPLAKKLKAAVGASRAAVDADYVSNELQIGQTGKIVAPEIYFAVGISGAIQHVAGMKDSRVVVAINSDPEAAIFQVADYSLAGDLFEILPELTEKL